MFRHQLLQQRYDVARARGGQHVTAWCTMPAHVGSRRLSGMGAVSLAALSHIRW